MAAGAHAAQRKRLGRHKSFDVLGEYLEFGTLFEGHPLRDLLCRSGRDGRKERRRMRRIVTRLPRARVATQAMVGLNRDVRATLFTPPLDLFQTSLLAYR